MTISSMTGFARADGSTDGLSWIWESRSVNGRGLDVRLRLPPGYEALEIPAREAVAKRFARGSISLSLSIEKQQTNGAIRLNEQVLADVIKAADRVSTLSGATKPDAAQLLMIKGVLETSDQATEDAAARASREKTILQSLEAALDKLGDARRAEGARLGGVIHDQISQIEQLAATVRASPSRAPEAVMTRLKDAIARLVDTTAALANLSKSRRRSFICSSQLDLSRVYKIFEVANVLANLLQRVGPMTQHSSLEDCHARLDSTPAPARSATTIHGGAFHTVRRRKPASASAKSRGVRTALIQTGL